MTYSNITRRQVLNGLVGTAALFTVPLPVIAATHSVREFSLKAQASTATILGGQWGDTPVWSYNGEIPGSMLRAKQGDRVRIHFENALLEPTTIHWHGFRIPNAMDGVPGISQDPIAPGESFTYDFTVPDAGTFWYHPHVNTSEQVARGLSGAFVVDEENPPEIDREELWVLDDWRLDRDGSIREDFGRDMDLSHEGRFGNVTTVNGKLPGTFNVRAGERIRLRLVNVANAKIFGLRFENHEPKVIAFDGQPVEPYVPTEKRFILGPGQRVDILFDCTGNPGDTFTVIDDVYQDEVYQMIDGVYSDETLLRDGFFASFNALPANPLSELDLGSAIRHEIIIEGGAMGGMKGAKYKGSYMPIRELMQYRRVWALNGVAADSITMPPILTVKTGSTNIIAVKNNTGFPHPMHLHGHAFRILTRNGRPEPLRPWADTVLLPAQSTAEIAFVADNPGDWLFHCHILEHVDGGMLSVIRVA